MTDSALVGRKTQKLVLSALFLTLAFLLPFLTAGNPQLGNLFCLMHLPVLLCGFFCGPFWGLAVGLIAPLFRSLLLGMPVLFPTACSMALELASYGFLAGFFYALFPKKLPFTYLSLGLSLLGGRAVLGLVNTLFFGILAKEYTLSLFLTAAFVTPWPGLLLQIHLIPPLVLLAKRHIR